jgi:hypothetical protein
VSLLIGLESRGPVIFIDKALSSELPFDESPNLLNGI